MAPISITHTTVKQDYSGSGAVSPNMELIASDWNAVHFVLNAGGGISIVSDGGTPPTLTFAVTSTEPTATTFGGSLIPTTDAIFDVGSLSLRWNNIFSSGTVSAGAVTAGTFSTGAVLISSAPTFSIKFFANGVGLSAQTGAFGNGIQIDGCGDLFASGDLCSNLGSDTRRWTNIVTPTWRNIGGTGLKLQVGNYSINVQDALPGSISVDSTSHAGLVDFGTPTLTYRNAYFAGTLSAGTLQFADSSLGGNLLPSVDNLYDVGSTTFRWRNLYFSGSVSSGASISTSTVSSGSGFQTNALNLLIFGNHFGMFTSASNDLTLQAGASKVTLQIFGSQGVFWDGAWTPPADNNNDIGKTGTRWRNGYFAGQVSSGTFVTNSTFQFGSAAQGAILTYDLTKGNSGSFIIENSSLVELVRIDNSTGKFSSAFTVSAATGFQTNANPSFTTSTTFRVFAGAPPGVGIDWDGFNFFTEAIGASLGTLSHLWGQGLFSSTISAGSGFQSNNTSATFDLAPNATWKVGGIGLFQMDTSTFFPQSDLGVTLGSGTKRFSVLNIGSPLSLITNTISAGSGFQTNALAGLTYGNGLGFTFPNDAGVRVSGGEFSPSADLGVPLGTNARRWSSVSTPTISNNAGTLAIISQTTELDLTLGDFSPTTDNIVDLGKNATGRYKNAYFAGTVSVGSQFFFSSGSTFALQALGNYILKINGGNVLELQSTFLRPATDGTIDLGQPASRWNNGYFAGTVSVGTSFIQVSGTNFLFNAGSQTDIRLNPGAGGAVNVNNAGITNIFGLNPATDNTNDIGTTALRWRNAYVAGNVSVGGNLIFTTAGSIIRSTGNQIKIDSSQLIPFSDNATQLGAATSRWTSSWFTGTTSSGTLQIGAGVVTAFNNRATAVNGVLAIVAEGDQTGASAANASLASFTVGATNGVFKVGGDVDVTVISGATVTLQVAYTDWSGNARTATLVSSTSLGDSPANDKTIMAQNGTAITMSTTLAGGTATWNVAGWIGWVK